jgi:hypothetical protein
MTASKSVLTLQREGAWLPAALAVLGGGLVRFVVGPLVGVAMLPVAVPLGAWLTWRVRRAKGGT